LVSETTVFFVSALAWAEPDILAGVREVEGGGGACGGVLCYGLCDGNGDAALDGAEKAAVVRRA
jgi:hypothetical protein